MQAITADLYLVYMKLSVAGGVSASVHALCECVFQMFAWLSFILLLCLQHIQNDLYLFELS